MTTKTKAKQLVEKMYSYQWREDSKEWRNAKHCAILLCDETIKALKKANPGYLQTTYWHPIDFWKGVKEEIKILEQKDEL